MRVAFVSTMQGSPWGGSEELWSQTALRLHDAGHAVSASVAFWPQPSPKVVALRARGIKLEMRVPNRPGLVARIRRKITFGPKTDYERLLNQRPDLVVISQGFSIEGLGFMRFCKDAGLPFVVIVQCNSEIWWPQDERDRGFAEAYLAARRVYCVSQQNLELLERQIGASLPNGSVIRNPVGVPSDQVPAWPQDTGTWRLASVARLFPPAKGQDLLFQVLSRPQWRDRDVEVNLYGSGPCEHALRRLAEHLQLKSVRFRGHVDNVAAIWEHNHLLVLPSRYEGLPIALVEAMWCGRPAVLTDVAGNTELCVDGETGFVAAAPVAALLERTMETAWDHREQWKTMGAAARTRVSQLISADPVRDFCQLLIACAS